MSHDLDILRKQLRERFEGSSIPKPQSLWKHYKGDIYKVDSVGIRESTLELEVCYRTAENPLECHWIRPLSEWHQKVHYNDVEVTRFTLIE